MPARDWLFFVECLERQKLIIFVIGVWFGKLQTSNGIVLHWVFDGWIQKAEIDRKVAEEVAREEFAVSPKFLSLVSKEPALLNYMPRCADGMEIQIISN